MASSVSERNKTSLTKPNTQISMTKQYPILKLQNSNDEISLKVVLWVIKMAVGFFRGLLFGFLVVEIMAMILFAVVETPLGNVTGYLFSITPRIGEVRGEIVHYGKEDVVYFFVFWGIVLYPVKWLFRSNLVTFVYLNNSNWRQSCRKILI